jgi:hypothetical protein
MSCHDLVSCGGSRARPWILILTISYLHSSSLLNRVHMTGCPLERAWTLLA